MAFVKIENVRVAGIAACVPPRVERNVLSEIIADKNELEKYIEAIGVKQRHVADEGICASDLCFASAEKLLNDLGWERSEIECLIFVSQTPDYIFPATSCILQDRLGVSTDCMCFDVTMSCAGWIYGLSIISSIISAGKVKKALLLVGETSTKAKSPFDRVNLLAGDAGTATALEFDQEGLPMYYSLHTDGSGYNKLIIPDGGYRNPTTAGSFEYVMCKDGILRNRLQANMEGDGIFSFAINTAPKNIKALFAYFNLDEATIDYYFIHQANQMINLLIQKRMRVDNNKFINNIENYGNTSSTSIPLAMVCKMKGLLNYKRITASAFGTGLAWASACLEFKELRISDLIIYRQE